MFGLFRVFQLFNLSRHTYDEFRDCWYKSNMLMEDKMQVKSFAIGLKLSQCAFWSLQKRLKKCIKNIQYNVKNNEIEKRTNNNTL